MNEDLLMAELLCARLCHDLTGPIGAVNNGAEFLSEEGFNLQGQAMELVVSSAFSAVTRLQFYRMAYGKVRAHGEASLSEIKKMSVDFFTDSKITLDWPDSHADASGVSISVRKGRILANLLVIAASVLIRGGSIAVRITQDQQGAKMVAVTAEGAGLKFDPETEKMLTQGATLDELSPKNVQTYFTRRLVEELGAVLQCTASEGSLTMQVMQHG
jgi:histidine phosphotransferase ChpT